MSCQSMRDPQKSAFDSAFRKTKKVKLAELLPICQCSSPNMLSMTIANWKLDPYYEIKGDYCIRNDTPTKWDKFKGVMKVGGKFLLSKGIPVAIGLATGGVGLGPALGAMIPEIIAKLQKRGLNVPTKISSKIGDVIQANSADALEDLVGGLAEANENEKIGGEAHSKEELETIIKLSVNEELSPYITEIKQSIQYLAKDQGHLTEILEGWMSDQEEMLAQMQATQAIDSQMINQTNMLLQELGQSMLPLLPSIDAKLDGISSNVATMGMQLQNMEQQMTKAFENLCRDRLADLSWEELKQVSRIQFQSIRLSGKWDDPFDPDLFLETPEITQSFNNFLTQRGYTRPLFLTLANIGMGKTWNMVYLGMRSRDTLDSALPFFIPIYLGYEELLGEIFGTLGLQLVSAIGTKAERIMNTHGKKILLIFDGLDEYPVADRMPFLNFLNQLLVQYKDKILIALSDRITDWNQHAQLQAFHSKIQEWIFTQPECDPIKQKFSIPTTFSGYLGEFSDNQLKRALINYHLDQIQLPANLFQLAHRPYILRLMLKWKTYPDPTNAAEFSPYFYNPENISATIMGRMGIVNPVDEYLISILELFGSASATKTNRDLAEITDTGKNERWFIILSSGLIAEKRAGILKQYTFDPIFHPILNKFLMDLGISPTNPSESQPNSTAIPPTPTSIPPITSQAQGGTAIQITIAIAKNSTIFDGEWTANVLDSLKGTKVKVGNSVTFLLEYDNNSIVKSGKVIETQPKGDVLITDTTKVFLIKLTPEETNDLIKQNQ